MNTVARPATVGLRQLRGCDRRIGCGVVLDRALDREERIALPDQRRRFADLVDVGAGARLAGRVRQHGHAWFDAELRGRLGRRDGDVGELRRPSDPG